MAKLDLTSAQQRQILFGVLGLIGLVVWMNFLVIPQQQTMAQTRSQVQQLERQLTETHRGLAQLPVMEEELARLSSQYKLPAVSQPSEEQLPDLLGAIAQMAKTAQVRLVTMKPKGDLGHLAAPPGETVLCQEIPDGSG